MVLTHSSVSNKIFHQGFSHSTFRLAASHWTLTRSMDAISTCLMLVGLLCFGVGFSVEGDTHLGTLKQIATGARHVWVENTDNEVFCREVKSPTSFGKWVKQPWSKMGGLAVTPNGYIWALNDFKVYQRTHITEIKPSGTEWTPMGQFLAYIVAAGYSGLWATPWLSSKRMVYCRKGTYGDSGDHGSAWIPKNVPDMEFISQVFVGPNNVWLLDAEGSLFYLPVLGDCSFGSWQSYDGHLTSESTKNMKRISISPAGNKWALWNERVGRGADKDAEGSKWILDDDQLNLIDISAGEVGVWAIDNSRVYYRSGTYGDGYDTTSLTGSWEVVN